MEHLHQLLSNISSSLPVLQVGLASALALLATCQYAQRVRLVPVRVRRTRTRSR